MTTVKIAVTRSDSYQEQCRVCQELSDEPLMELGCGCRGELAKVHKSCIEIWFGTRGSNKCEICQQIAVNVPLPESHPGTNYWIWRVDPAYGISNVGNPENQRRSFNPIWIAFCILIGGLLLDVFVSISFGISALPVNIIIGALILLGLGTALRLALKCRSDWNTRRFVLQRTTGVAPPPSESDHAHSKNTSTDEQNGGGEKFTGEYFF
ncbi:unnamed protein product [Spirodela intermedia]|uniref:Uncharacterized protein n=1 Tax=Spirodela intermedia TaxID=51605 RepID=A0A7I8JUC2_SPIIN|nr:unnamed protein product [Spirodela intermedia]CAA6673694.1 unnamed protein product [Spirodela intermedia]